MSLKATLPFTCPCEKEHLFEETYRVTGPGNSRVEPRCPNPQCPAKNPRLSYVIPFQLDRDEDVFKGKSGEPKS